MVLGEEDRLAEGVIEISEFKISDFIGHKDREVASEKTDGEEGFVLGLGDGDQTFVDERVERSHFEDRLVHLCGRSKLFFGLLEKSFEVRQSQRFDGGLQRVSCLSGDVSLCFSCTVFFCCFEAVFLVLIVVEIEAACGVDVGGEWARDSDEGICETELGLEQMELLFSEGDLVRVQSGQEDLLSGVALFMIPDTKKKKGCESCEKKRERGGERPSSGAREEAWKERRGMAKRRVTPDQEAVVSWSCLRKDKKTLRGSLAGVFEEVRALSASSCNCSM